MLKKDFNKHKAACDEAIASCDLQRINACLYDMAEAGDVASVRKLLKAGGQYSAWIKGKRHLPLTIALENGQFEVLDVLLDQKSAQTGLPKGRLINGCFNGIIDDSTPENTSYIDNSQDRLRIFVGMFQCFKDRVELEPIILYSAIEGRHTEIAKFIVQNQTYSHDELNRGIERAFARNREDIKRYIQSFKVLKIIQDTIDVTSNKRYDGTADMPVHDLLNRKAQFCFDGMCFHVPQYVMGLYSNRAEEVLIKIIDHVTPEDIAFGDIALSDVLTHTGRDKLYVDLSTQKNFHQKAYQNTPLARRRLKGGNHER